MEFDPSKVGRVDFSSLDVQKLESSLAEHLSQIDQSEIDELVQGMKKVVAAADQRQALIDDTMLFLKFAAMVMSVV